MIEVKVKTLDGQTQEYSLPDDVSVLQFKEIIHEKTEIEVERQRLLFQGRVLLDDRILNSYGVDGNVMHLVTRMPPQSRPTEEVLTDIDDNSDASSDQFRNIFSDVFGSLGDLNNPMGNEGNRMDITVNIPAQNRLSLSRLRQNYVTRLLDQARQVIGHMADPSSTEPRPDRERMRQVDPYDISPDEEILTEVTSEPLRIGSLADMLGETRRLWSSAEPQLAAWEGVLRREEGPGSIQRSDIEMQRIHDSASRYLHLFSHVLHILSDYLVEFQATAITRATAARLNANTTNNESTNTVGDNSAALPSESQTNDANPTSATSADVPVDPRDRSRFLYVFSEMPAQLVQVRLDSTIHDMRSTASTPARTTHPATVNMQPPRTTQGVRTQSAPVTQSSATATPNNTPITIPTSIAPTEPNSIPPRSEIPATRPRRRPQTSGAALASNLLRSTLHDTLLGSSTRPQSGAGTRTLRSGSSFMDNIDPYLRCQSRHFQHPSSLRSGAVISTISGIRLRDPLRSVPRTAASSVSSDSTTRDSTVPIIMTDDNDPMESILSGLMNSIFNGQTPDTNRSIIPTRPTSRMSRGRSRMQRLLNSVNTTSRLSLDATLAAIYPELVASQGLSSGNYITNQIMNIVINQLSFMDFLSIVRGRYTALNRLREPLQNVLRTHQQEAGSRDNLIEHFISDLQIYRERYIPVLEQLRSGAPVGNLSEEARNSLNSRLDITQTMNNINRHHFQAIIDMIMHSPTNQGFGTLLMDGIKNHHAQTLALIDILCNGNAELRKFLTLTMLDSYNSGSNQNPEDQPDPIALDVLFGDVSSELFSMPGRLAQLRENTMTNFVVYLTEEDAVAADNEDVSMTEDKLDLIDDIVTNLSEELTAGAQVPDSARLLDTWQGVAPDDWIPVMSRDASAGDAAMLVGDNSLPYSDAYVSGMPAKRRKVLVSKRTVGSAAEMMNECLDQAVASVGLTSNDQAPMPSLTDAFKDVVTEKVTHRLAGAAADGSHDFVPEKWPAADRSFNTARTENTEDEKKNN